MAKLNRERKLIEKRVEKQAKKDARRRAAADQPSPSIYPLTDAEYEPSQPVQGSSTDSPSVP